MEEKEQKESVVNSEEKESKELKSSSESKEPKASESTSREKESQDGEKKPKKPMSKKTLIGLISAIAAVVVIAVVLAVVFAVVVPSKSSNDGGSGNVELSTSLENSIKDINDVKEVKVDAEKKTIEMSVSSDTETFSFSSLQLKEGAALKIYTDETMTKEITGEVTLQEGNNTYFAVLIKGTTTLQYTLTVKREKKTDSAVAHTHTFGDWTVVTPADCTKKGSRKRTCACGEEETEEIAALGHNYVDGVCTICGDQPTPSSYVVDYPDGFSTYWTTDALKTDGVCFSYECETKNDSGETTDHYRHTIAAKGNKYYDFYDYMDGREEKPFYFETTESESNYFVYSLKNGNWEKNTVSYGQTFDMGDISICFESKEELESARLGVMNTYIEMFKSTFANETMRMDYGTYYIYETILEDEEEVTILTMKVDKETGRPLEVQGSSQGIYDGITSVFEMVLTMPYEIVLPEVVELETVQSSYVEDFPMIQSENWGEELISNGICWISDYVAENYSFRNTLGEKGNIIYHIIETDENTTLYYDDGQVYVEITDSETEYYVYVKKNGKWEKHTVLYGTDQENYFRITNEVSIHFSNKEEFTENPTYLMIKDIVDEYFTEETTRTDYGTYYIYETTAGDEGEETIFTMKVDKETGNVLQITQQPVVPSEDFVSYTDTFIVPYSIVLPEVEHEHSFGDWTIETPADCTHTGLRIRTCACGEEETEEITALGHAIVHHDGQEATCTENGWEEYDTCSRCDYTTYEVIPAGHDFIHHEGQAATCTEIGWEEYDTCSRCDYTTYEEIPAGHDFIHHEGQAATCTEIGWEAYDTCSRCDYTTYEEIPAGHDFIHHEGQVATCAQTGWEAYDVCSRCSYSTYEIIPAMEHTFVNGVCSVCGTEEQPPYTRINNNGVEDEDGDYLYFGTYPQTRVIDTTITTVLTNAAGTLPTSSNSQAWTSYGYYISGSNSTDFMWYIDLMCDGEKYRGVYFTSYRPYWTHSSTSYTYQDYNGYSTSTVYWFRYDPVKWRILSEDNGEALILCEMIIDSPGYYYYSYGNMDMTRNRTAVANYNDDYYAGNGSAVNGDVYDNNYQYSAIRKWLNEMFYNTAFTDLQKALIQVTMVDNSTRSTNPNNNATELSNGKNRCACENTQDKVFLLSMQEVTDSAYGFNSSYKDSDTVRRKKNTDYAKCQGAYTDTRSDTLGNGSWWLRSPYPNCGSAYLVGRGGLANDNTDVDYTGAGVVPALRIKFPEPAYTRVNSSDEEDEDGDYLYFGTYPQTEVTDSAITTALTSVAGTLPTAESSQNWTTYEYYIEGSNSTDFMWYIDLDYGGEKYRGVYFTSYRPYGTTYSGSTDKSEQDNNGYYTSTVYWFRYDPIKWRILLEENGEALILCEMIIDSQEYCHYTSTSKFSHNAGTGYANNYALSNIRKWLNDTFYNTAFTDLQKALIQVTTVDNSARSTNPNDNATDGNNPYACANTEDKIFLLSEQEVTNSAYGFNSSHGNRDTLRRKNYTDYAKCQGVYTRTSSDYLGNGYWWLRSPFYHYSYSALYVSYHGAADSATSVSSANFGVVPALRIKL